MLLAHPRSHEVAGGLSPSRGMPCPAGIRSRPFLSIEQGELSEQTCDVSSPVLPVQRLSLYSGAVAFIAEE
jgi:hypothetical protein